MRTHAANYDAVIADGIWQHTCLGTWLALRSSKIPYFIVMHGMLDPSFKRYYPLKHVKKQVYWVLAAYWILRGAHAALYWTEQERVLARQSFWPYRFNEAVVGLSIEQPEGDASQQRSLFFREFPGLRYKRLVLFMGRIHPHKGCDLLIEAFAHISHSDPRLHLVFVGPDDGWQKRLRKRIVKLGLEDNVTWTGMLTGDMKWGAYNAAEVLVLPSHSESFGFVVAEAMACGVPVLISDKVNIWREVEATGGGFAANDDLSGTTALLDRWLSLTPNEHEIIRSKAKEGFAEKFSYPAALEKLNTVLNTLNGRMDDQTGVSPVD